MFKKALLFSIVLIFSFSCFLFADVVVSNLVPDKYKVEPISVNMVYYVDRAYTIISFPNELKDATVIRTGNDDKNSKGDGFLKFNINQSATVYVAHDSRGESAKGGVPPEWLSKNFTFIEGKVI
ncbi:MAG: hypothetical protein ACPL7B_05805, partial [Candidatus Poribacteria bacterium]